MVLTNTLSFAAHAVTMRFCVPRLLILDTGDTQCCSGNCSRLSAVLRAAFPEGILVTTADAFPDAPDRSPTPDLVVLRSPDRSALKRILNDVRQRWQGIPVLAMLCDVQDHWSDLLDSLLQGLDDFFYCPFRDIDLIPRVRRLLPGAVRSDLPLNLERLQRNLDLTQLVGESEGFLLAAEKIAHIAKSDATVLITGETGTGKELFARAIHYNGARRNKPFIPVNCAALPDHLIENELFGHSRGAYTDASSAEKGVLAEAEGGSLFLDEIDALSPCAQAKLLRVLQDREYRPLGCSRAQTANVRILAATNSNLRERVSIRAFREDLFYRLNILSMCVPPLRERVADIPLLANHFLERFGTQYGRGPVQFSRPALRKLLAYSWPGNVREMEGLVHRAVVLTSAAVLQPADIEIPADAADHGVSPLQTAKRAAIGVFEKSYLSDLLAEHKGNISRAAIASGKDRRTLQRLVRKHGLERLAFQQLA